MKTIYLATALAMLAGAARAAPLTYEAALQLARRTAPVLAARSADLDAARAASTAAGRLPDPKLRVGLENFPVSGPPAWRFGPEGMTMATVGLMQDAPSGAERRAQRERGAADVGAAQSSERIAARSVRLSTALAWLDLHYAERRLAALDEVKAALTPLRRTAPSQLAVGAMRPAQALEPQQMLAALADRRDDLVAEVAKARAELARWTGDPDPEVAGAPPPAQVDPAALRAGLDRQPDLLAYDAMRRQAEADVALARAARRPDWTWELAYEHRDRMWGDMVSLGATVSLPIFARKRQDPVIAARTDALSRVRSEREAARRALVAQLDVDLADYGLREDRLRRAEQVLVPLARRKADLERAGYAGGEATLPDVLQAQIALADARLDAIARKAEAVRDAVRIDLTYEAARP